ncbi:recombinase family protein [Rhizobium leguminosarum]|uniref:recombinase family protein n=1 Tax=Rhizobium leguminosarum TaxID=384 RepID=UPI003D7C1A52
MDDDGKPIRGLRDIDAGEAATIVWIFKQYATGISPDTIAGLLNARGLPGPRGRSWRGTAIRETAEEAPASSTIRCTSVAWSSTD